MSRARWILAAVLVLALCAGCGGGTGADTASQSPLAWRKLRINLEGKAGPRDAGILMAAERGYFEDAGLTVAVYTPIAPGKPIQYLAEGAVELAVSPEPEVVLAQEQDAAPVAIGSLVSRPAAAMIWLQKSGINGIGDLKGKTIAIPGLRFQKAFLQDLLAQAGLTLADVELKDVGYKLVPTLLRGRADAIFGGSATVEGIELEEKGAKPVVIPVSRIGVPPYSEAVLVARRDVLARDPQVISDFVSAVARGTAAAMADPKAAARAIVAENSAREIKSTEAELKATLPSLSKTDRIDPEQADRLVEWMADQGMVKDEPRAYSCKALTCSSSSIP